MHAGPSIGDTFAVRTADAVSTLECIDCGYEFGPVDRDPKLGAVMSERSITDLSVLNAVGMVDRLVAREYYCPGCALLLSVNVQQHGDPVMLEWALDPETVALRS